MTETEDVYNGPARTFEELCAAFKLVQWQYQALRYARATSSGMRYSIFNLLPTTRTAVAIFRNRLVGTATLITDTNYRLPLANVFPEEYNFLKKDGCKIAEGSMFACEPELDNKGMGMQLSLLRCTLTSCLEQGIKKLCLVIHPKHLGFYQKVLGFILLADEKVCAHVENVPGNLIYKDIPCQSQPPNTASLFDRMLVQAGNFLESQGPGYAINSQDIKKLLLWEPELYYSIKNQFPEFFEQHTAAGFLDVQFDKALQTNKTNRN